MKKEIKNNLMKIKPLLAWALVHKKENEISCCDMLYGALDIFRTRQEAIFSQDSHRKIIRINITQIV